MNVQFKIPQSNQNFIIKIIHEDLLQILIIQIYALYISIIISSIHLGTTQKDFLSLFNFVYTLEGKTNGWDFFFYQTPKLRKMKTKQKTLPMKGFFFYSLIIFSPIFPEKKSKISQTCTRKQHFPKKKSQFLGSKDDKICHGKQLVPVYIQWWKISQHIPYRTVKERCQFCIQSQG